MLADSVQDEINNLKNNQTPESSVVSIDIRNQVDTAAYINIPDGYYAEKIKWLRDNVAIPDATGYAYILTADDMMKNITLSIESLLGGNRVSDKTTGQIGGIMLESAGPAGSIYEGYTLSAGDDFNTLDILSPANPKGRWFTTRTYLNPPRGSDTQLGTMYDTDPAFTGFNDSNRGVPVGFDNMRVEDGVLRLQARAATANEKPHLQGSRHDLAAMVSSVGAFSFFAGPAGTGDCIIEWYAMFTHKTQNPPGGTRHYGPKVRCHPTPTIRMSWILSRASASLQRQIIIYGELMVRKQAEERLDRKNIYLMASTIKLAPSSIKVMSRYSLMIPLAAY